ncbi:transposase [Rhodobacterales bacterium]|nr:transposase [Rhodobacterales bacterium]
MIRRDHPDLSISQQCKLVKLSRAAFYYMPVGVGGATLELMKAIDRAFTKYPFFGGRQIAAYLRRDSIVVGRHRVRRLMAKMGLEAIYKRPRTSQPHPQHKVYPYLLRGMTIDRPNQVLLSAIKTSPAGQRVSGHHLHPREARFSVSGCDYGLGDAESSELAAVEHDARRLLRRSLERGHRPLRTA